eukprot:gene22632-30904_t
MRSGWYPTYLKVQNKKLQCNNELSFGPSQNRLINFFKSSIFISFLEILTGIPGLVFDPHYYGGGLHQTLPGGHLSIHADFNWHGELHMWRRVNVFLYLNPDWDPAWGGELQLWDSMVGDMRRTISPTANTLVIFSSSDNTFHGHPDPLHSPAGVSRKSIALYYYTTEPGPYQSKRQGTDFRERPVAHRLDLYTIDYPITRFDRLVGQ